MMTKDFQEVAHNYLDIFHRGERYFNGDQKRAAYFKKNPLNVDAAEVMVKISAIEHDLTDDTIYSWQVMADHIASLPVDEALHQGVPDIVDIIAHVEVQGHTYFLYSFASRYCNWHNPVAYPIYNLAIRRLLTFYWQEVKQRTLHTKDFCSYPRFKELMLAFRKQMLMDEYNFKELDTFSWIYGDKIIRDLMRTKQPAYH